MKVGVLGLGSIGLRHAGNLRGLGVAVAGFDPDPARREALRELGGEPSESRAHVLESSDAIVIASPNASHLPDLAEAVAAGRHAFVEKPLAHRCDGLQALAAEAQAKRTVVFVAHNLRYHPCVEQARQRLDDGAIGALLWARLLVSSYLPSWRPQQDYRLGYTADPRTGGVLFDNIHEVDLAAHLLGPARVIAAAARRTGTLEIAAEDCADLILRHAGGWQSSVHLDYASRNRQRITEIVGSDGLMRLDLTARTLRQLSPDGEAIRPFDAGGSINDDYTAEIADFLACVRGETAPRCPFREAIAILEQMIAARAMAGLPPSDDDTSPQGLAAAR